MRPIRFFASLICLLFFILNTAYAAKTETLTLDVLIAGVKYNDSLVESGKGDFVIQQTLTDFGKAVLNVQKTETIPLEYFFAFDGKKIYSDPDSGIFRNYVFVFDGEKQVEIEKSEESPRIGVRGSLLITPRSNLQYWGLFFNGEPVGEYLEKNATAVLGKELIGKTLCYIIQAKCPGINIVKFWVAPSKGYRILKREYNTSYTGGIPANVTMLVEYEKLKDDIWFPKSGTDTTMALNKLTGKNELVFKYTLSVKNFELNADVSDLFRLDIPPDVKVFDYRIDSERTAGEAGISQ